LPESLRYDTPIRPLTVTLGDDLPGDTISRITTSRIMMIHVNTAAASRRERLQQFQVDLRIISAHKGKGDQSPTAKMFTNEAIDNVAVLESIKQRGEAFGLIVQRKHRLVHKREGGAARFGQNSILGDPILEYCQLHRFRSVSPEVTSDRISMRLSCMKVRIYALGFGFVVKTYICKNGKNEHGAQTDQELGRLTFHGFPRALDFLKKELFGVRSPRSFGKSNVDFGNNYL
jgi:hypothetical protein